MKSQNEMDTLLKLGLLPEAVKIMYNELKELNKRIKELENEKRYSRTDSSPDVELYY